jgi:chromate reductase, NAD(P)H dehydrogenase (quinone)
MAKILAFSGSSRSGSYNLQLLRVAVRGARDAGAEVTEVDLRALALPLMDEDLEKASGLPVGALRFKELLNATDGFLIASPEYNSMPTPLLINALDWASRRAPGEAAVTCFRGKSAALVSASPGALGGIRALPVIRHFLHGLGTLVLPGDIAVGAAHSAFDPQGNLVDPKRQEAVLALGAGLARFLDRR